ncbi:hypothetical protein D3C76_997160 [compost metagenome]
MAVPHRFLLSRQRGKQLLVDDVLDAHDLRTLGIAVEDHTLDDILIKDRAVVVRFHLHVGTAVVEVKAIQVGVDGLNRRLGLQHRSAGLQQLDFSRLWSAWGLYRRLRFESGTSPQQSAGEGKGYRLE